MNQAVFRFQKSYKLTAIKALRIDIGSEYLGQEKNLKRRFLATTIQSHSEKTYRLNLGHVEQSRRLKQVYV